MMKRWILVLFAVLVAHSAAAQHTRSPRGRGWCPPAPVVPVDGPIALIQQAVASSSASPLVVTLPGAPTAGSTLVLTLALGSFRNVTSVTGAGVTWLQANNGSSEDESPVTYMYYGQGSTGSGSTVTIVWSGGATTSAANVSEWAGISTPDDFPAIGDPSSYVASATATAGQRDTQSDNSLVIAAISGGAATYLSGPSAGFTRLAPVTGATALETSYIIGTPGSGGVTLFETTITWTAPATGTVLIGALNGILP